MPGQTSTPCEPSSAGPCCFNGGPGTCPAKRRGPRSRPPSRSRFNGGPGTCPAKPNTWGKTAGVDAALQWRAGHVPGQTRGHRRSRPRGSSASMEGRARARPNTTSPRWPPSRQSSFNGGPGTCPAKRRTTRATCMSGWCFNGGPGTCPAKQGADHVVAAEEETASMEGRARARPNAWLAAAPDLQSTASMEGRARARPNDYAGIFGQRVRMTLQWRAGHVPGQTGDFVEKVLWPLMLQWRAGHVPGQTTLVMRGPEPATVASMEGRARARPNEPHSGGAHGAAPQASMEGRARARPNCAARSQPAAQPLASMEGRARARPNLWS